MKQTLIALLALAMLASCAPKNDEAKKKEDNNNSSPQIPGIDPILVTESEADSMIQRYHRYLLEQANKNVKDPEDSVTFDHIKDNQNLSFMIDANILRAYLDSNQNFGMLDFYLAMNDESKITLVYVGAKQMLVPNPNGGGDSIEAYVEQPYYIEGDATPNLLDHAMPCPVCEDRISRINH